MIAYNNRLTLAACGMKSLDTFFVRESIKADYCPCG